MSCQSSATRAALSPAGFIMLLISKSFYGREDQGLTDKLLKELPGVLNWALAGWAALKRKGHFIQPASAKQALEQLEDLSSPIGAFVRERCETGAAFSVSTSDVFNAWVEWCAGQRRPGRRHAGRTAPRDRSGLVWRRDRERAAATVLEFE